MPRNRELKLATLFFTIAFLLGTVGCATSRKSSSSVSEVPSSPAAQPVPAAAPAPAPAVAEAPRIPVRTESLYFEFDRSDLNPASREFLSGFGGLLAKHPDLNVRIEGNCDERGTAQYNVALGYRRADAARKYLLEMGAGDDQIKTVSYGKERPRATGHDEESWRKNRRADFIPDRDTLPGEP